MRRSIVVWFALSVLFPGCGLTLDYDPPTDGGSGMDGAIDTGADASGCGVACADGTVCIGGSCLHPCTDTSDCHFDDATCEICDPSIGACVASTATCGGGCGAVCDPVEDRCRANCDDDESCVDDECVPAIPCTTPSDCPVTSTGCGFECVAGTCQALPALVCPDADDYECAYADGCAACDIVLIADFCDPSEFCDFEGGTYRCIECSESVRCTDSNVPICVDGTCQHCNEDRECAAAGLGNACVESRCVQCGDAADCEAAGLGGACVGNACVPCDEDADCSDPLTPVCDLDTNRCVRCNRASECGAGAVCRGDHTCGPCAVDSDCGGAVCEGGVCQRSCLEASDCPPSCAGPANQCMTGRCVYPPGGTSTACNDSAACTNDVCAPNDTRADTFGCIRTAVHTRCDDEVACTVDRCVFVAGGARCENTPSNAICRGTTGSEPRCLDQVCLPSASAGARDARGCVRSYVGPCAPGEVCGVDGVCSAVTRCEDCMDDGLACNGVETCVGGLCTQTFTGGSCTGLCDQYCLSNTACAALPDASVTCRLAPMP